jgi:hypothetical protein
MTRETDNGRREAVRYLRDLADRLVDYPTDHYKEAAEALRAYADETEAVALGAASPVSPDDVMDVYVPGRWKCLQCAFELCPRSRCLRRGRRSAP